MYSLDYSLFARSQLCIGLSKLHYTILACHIINATMCVLMKQITSHGSKQNDFDLSSGLEMLLSMTLKCFKYRFSLKFKI